MTRRKIILNQRSITESPPDYRFALLLDFIALDRHFLLLDADFFKKMIAAR